LAEFRAYGGRIHLIEPVVKPDQRGTHQSRKMKQFDKGML